MALRQIKMKEKNTESDIEEQFSQRKRPELGRFLLQVDRQTKGSYPTAEAAQAVGIAIKTGHPILHVTVYDSLESATTTVALAASKPGVD